jgi:hypothetical protein
LSKKYPHTVITIHLLAFYEILVSIGFVSLKMKINFLGFFLDK